MKKKIGAAFAGLLLAAGGVMLFAAPANAVFVCTSGACADEYSGWQGVTANDVSCDSYGVYTNYQRDTGGNQVLNNYQGCNTHTETGTSSNLIFKFRACRNQTGPDNCSSYIYR